MLKWVIVLDDVFANIQEDIVAFHFENVRAAIVVLGTISWISTSVGLRIQIPLV